VAEGVGTWRECWPPNEAPNTIVRARVMIPLAPGVFSYWITVEDTAAAFTKFMQPSTI
jgi:hypothetical protein